jgi:hypothetical protein
MTRKLQAREDFEKGDVGCVIGNKVSKPTQPGRPVGSVLVTALQDVKAGKKVGLKSNDDSSHARAPNAGDCAGAKSTRPAAPTTIGWVESWDSIAGMRRFTWVLTLMAFACAIIGLSSWPVTLVVAIPAVILGTTAVLCAAFAWFRLEHLRDLDRLQ